MMGFGVDSMGRPRRPPTDGATKVCSFFATEKGCAKGASCDFLHEPPKKRPRPCQYYATPEGCKKGKSCDFLHTGPGGAADPEARAAVEQSEPSEANPGEQATEGGDGTGEAVPKKSPKSDQKQPCAYFNSKLGCKKGLTCDFLHEKTAEAMKPPAQASVDRPCDFWSTPAGCRKGALCNFQHPGFNQQSKNSRGEAKVCTYFSSPRGCIKGAQCDFQHVMPTSAYQVANAQMHPVQMQMAGTSPAMFAHNNWDAFSQQQAQQPVPVNAYAQHAQETFQQPQQHTQAEFFQPGQAGADYSAYYQSQGFLQQKP